ncbi:MAG TPA: diiron oxygenase [Gordonia sp. (in: high G+C Gram-positive bacteria)]|uniref:diiron oxygenase n=1 Tax=unclassified Gordonia (in: high G+C Gram-positive bacteria) TaxID=2657482 RepID=UPI000FA1467E|nr:MULTISPECIES: diiron oxygenase [unclassified Gordonia (in: high G+C Gram-positive bacteria)]RUP40009.1 MAG: hypothetical protein EKK60_05270 [Gordonia sp. (in: high G+C Gram-positive bacteria)]HNP56579.1 diiron oxygenase [Gordonia sp. (in: high G+C Gram-positive bacteria)]HRC49668.1 diiron oxygenase [Gordonia sp. (in: high G+C Gram-positive bacteria)]
MDERDERDGLPRTVEGGPAKHRGRIADRQTTAQRLLLAAAEESYSGDLDVDWDADVAPNLAWFPTRLSSIHGSPEWECLTPDQRIELGRHELVNVLTFAMRAEAAITLLMFRNIGESANLMSDVTRYTLKAIQEETRNSAMFSRLVNKTGLAINRPHREAWLTAKFVLFVPAGILTSGLILLLQEAIHSYATAMAVDPTVQPHVRQAMRIHEMSDHRHLEYSLNEFRLAVGRAGRLRRRVTGAVLARATAGLYPLILNGAIYPSIGIDSRSGLRIAHDEPQYSLRARALTDSFVSHAREAGLFRTRHERAILRRGKVWPAEVPDTVPAGGRDG